MRIHSAITNCASIRRWAALLSLLIGWIFLLSGNALGACEAGGLGAVCFDTDYDPSIRNPVKANDLMTESLQTSVGEHGMALMHYKGSLMFVDRDGVWSYRGGLGRLKWGDYGTIFSGGAARIACGPKRAPGRFVTETIRLTQSLPVACGAASVCGRQMMAKRVRLKASSWIA